MQVRRLITGLVAHNKEETTLLLLDSISDRRRHPESIAFLHVCSKSVDVKNEMRMRRVEPVGGIWGTYDYFYQWARLSRTQLASVVVYM